MKKSTDITIVLDRSGSMQSVAKETIEGFNRFLDEQKDAKIKAKVTLAQFDHEYELLYEGAELEEAGPLSNRTYIPRGLTALLDAIGRTIELTKDRVSKFSEKEMPRVVFVIITDGHENNSRKYSRVKIFKKISKLEKKHGWQFVFLGANQDAIEEASTLGIPQSKAMTFRADASGVGLSFSALSKNMIQACINDEDFSFTEAQRKEQDLPL